MPLLDDMKKQMPKIYLDSVMFYGRGKVGLGLKTLLTHDPLAKVPWGLLRFVVFDSPDPEITKSAPFEQRYQKLQTNIAATHPLLLVEPYFTCNGQQHALDWTNWIWRFGGEGSIFREPKALYSSGKTNTIIKLKAQHETEARVEQIVKPGKCQCVLPTGDRFEAKCPLDLFVKTGNVVNVHYSSKSKGGNLLYAEIYKISDKRWEDLTKVQKTNKKIENLQASEWNVREARRKFFNNFAAARNFNPLNPTNWETITRKDIYDAGGGIILHLFDGNPRKAISDAYPEINWSKSMKVK